MSNFPQELFDFAFIQTFSVKIDELAAKAEPENWNYQHSPTGHNKPILVNYLNYTYKRLVEENKISISDNGDHAVFNTGLVTANQEPLFAFFVRNTIPDRQPWYLRDWVRRGQNELSVFQELPDMAHYFDDPKALVFDVKKDFRPNIEHIIADNKERFPEPYKTMDDYVLQTLLKGAIDNARERVRRNYKSAIPQYYHSQVQLLLPLCISSPKTADLALVVIDHGNFYRASTCLTLDMAYNNARLLARPDRDWLEP